MNEEPKGSATGPKAGLATAGLGVLAVVCCAGGPLIAGAFGSIAIGGILGVGAGVLAVVVVSALIVLRVRHRRARTVPHGQTRGAQPRRGGGL